MYRTGFPLLVTAFAVLLLSACKSGNEDKDPPEPTTQQVIQRGEYLVTVMGCHDCHSPKNISAGGFTLIENLLLSGYHSDMTPAISDASCIKDGWALISMDLTAAGGPWGVSYSANLTSDQTGIGNWTIENFTRALKEGKFKGMENGRTLLPPMPWTNFVNLKDDDLKSIFTFLQSTNPVNNAVPPPVLPDQLFN